uniref:Small ribosomal subunit protein uS10m n=1 Tax=Magallana gigas TaxID=29159 RepID=K1R1T1_MAGGI
MASGRAVVACRRASTIFQKAITHRPFSIRPVLSLPQNHPTSSSYHFPRGLSTIDTQPTQGTEGGGGGGEDELFSKIIVEVKGHDPKVLDSYYWYLKQTAFHLDLGPHDTYVQKKPVIDKLTLNKSVHIYKKHRYYYLTGSTASTFLEYIQRNLPEGVAMKVTKSKQAASEEDTSSSDSDSSDSDSDSDSDKDEDKKTDKEKEPEENPGNEKDSDVDADTEVNPSKEK